MTEGDPLINLTTTRIGSAAVVTVEGELDLHTARTLMGTVDDTLTTPDLAAIVIDLSGVTFLGSSGLGTLAELATRTPSSRPRDAQPDPGAPGRAAGQPCGDTPVGGHEAGADPSAFP